MNNQSVEPESVSGQPPAHAPDPISRKRESPVRLWFRRLIGKTVLRVCPWEESSPCPKGNCRLQPFCACARADWAAAKKAEGRVWALVAGCSVLVLAIALAHAFLFK